MADDLVTWLRARLDEDEELARRAGWGWGQSWTEEHDTADDWSYVHADGKRDMVGSEDRDVTRHIARHDPAAILADISAKRTLIDQYEVAHQSSLAGDGGDPVRLVAAAAARSYLSAIALLGAAYASRPGWREEWSRG